MRGETRPEMFRTGAQATAALLLQGRRGPDKEGRSSAGRRRMGRRRVGRRRVGRRDITAITTVHVSSGRESRLRVVKGTGTPLVRTKEVRARTLVFFITTTKIVFSNFYIINIVLVFLNQILCVNVYTIGTYSRLLPT